MIASGKGGVGKSTVSALLGEALAFAGHPTLLAELDSGLRSLDVALGVTAGVLFDMGDVARGCAPADAVMQCPFCEKLSLICASASNAAVDEKTISGSIDLTDLKLGAHNVLITFELDTNTVSYADTYAAVTIESASDTSASADNTDEELESTSTVRKTSER